MFTNCPFCGFLVALDAQGQPLPRCPNCAQRLRDDNTAAAAVESDSAKAVEHTATHAPDGDVVDHTAPAKPAEPVPPEPQPSAADNTQRGVDEGSQPAPTPVDIAEPTPVPKPAAAALPIAPEPPTPAAEPAKADEVATATASISTDPAPAPTTHRDARPTPAEMLVIPAPTLCRDGTTADAARAPHVPAPPTPAAPQMAAQDATESATAPTLESSDAGAVVDAAETPLSTEAAPAPSDTAASKSAETASTDALEESPTAPAADVEPAESNAGASEQAAAPAEPAASPKPRKRAAAAAPSFVQAARSVPPVDRKRRAIETGAVAGLSLLLAIQLLVADRARLAGDARWRPLVTSLCGALGCSLPPWREPTAFRVVERDVRARTPGVLRVSARIRNEARWAQPWPMLQLTLADAHGREVATRLFSPGEYLGGTPTQAQLGSGQDASLSMDIIEPGPQAVAFTFDFK